MGLKAQNKPYGLFFENFQWIDFAGAWLYLVGYEEKERRGGADKWKTRKNLFLKKTEQEM